MMTQILSPSSPNLLLTSLLGWFALVNILAFLAFFLDHRRALADQGAMPEGPLLLLSSVGGWLGAQLGQMCFQGQERERSFRTFLNLSVLPMLALAGMIAAQDVDWAGLAAKGQAMIAAQVNAPEAAPVVAAPVAPAKPAVVKPEVRNTAKTSKPKDSVVTANPDLPKRIGPTGKKEAWQSR